jgi:hypothetical protein
MGTFGDIKADTWRDWYNNKTLAWSSIYAQFLFYQHLLSSVFGTSGCRELI